MTQLQLDLYRYARGNDRRMAIRTLKEHTFLATFIPLDTAAVPFQHSSFFVDTHHQNTVRFLSLSELEEEINEETLIINGVVIKPRRLADKYEYMSHAGSNNGSLFVLKALLTKAFHNSTDEEALNLYKRLLVRLAKSTASDDICTQLKTLLTNNNDQDAEDDLIVVQRLLPGKHIVKTAMYTSDANAIRLDIYDTETTTTTENDDGSRSATRSTSRSSGSSSGQSSTIHIEIHQTIDFGLFRTSNNDNTVNRPWIILNCKIHDRFNLSTNEGIRSFHLQTPKIY